MFIFELLRSPKWWQPHSRAFTQRLRHNHLVGYCTLSVPFNLSHWTCLWVLRQMEGKVETIQMACCCVAVQSITTSCCTLSPLRREMYIHRLCSHRQEPRSLSSLSVTFMNGMCTNQFLHAVLAPVRSRYTCYSFPNPPNDDVFGIIRRSMPSYNPTTSAKTQIKEFMTMQIVPSTNKNASVSHRSRPLSDISGGVIEDLSTIAGFLTIEIIAAYCSWTKKIPAAEKIEQWTFSVAFVGKITAIQLWKPFTYYLMRLVYFD